MIIKWVYILLIILKLANDIIIIIYFIFIHLNLIQFYTIFTFIM